MGEATERRELNLGFKIEIDYKTPTGFYGIRVIPDQAFFVIKEQLDPKTVEVILKYQVKTGS